MENTVESAKEELTKQVSLVQIAALIVGLFYVSGYYINSMFLKNYGIPGTELFRLEYVKIGFVFWLIISGLVLLPFGAFYLTNKVRSSSGLPHYKIGLIGTSLNVIVMLGVPIALSFLATNFEWNYAFTKPVLGFDSFNHSMSFALGLSTFLVIVLPAIERISTKQFSESKNIWIFRLVIEPVRYGGLILTLYLIARSIAEVPWLPTVLGKSIPFVSVVVILGSGLLAAYYWVSFIGKTKGSLMVIPLITLGVAFFYYLAMASYVYGLYPAIPSNRGGKLPLTQVFLQIDGYDSIFQSSRNEGGLSLKGPVYVIEEMDKSLYFASKGMDKWFEEFIQINSVKKQDIKYMLSERINDGFPKTTR